MICTSKSVQLLGFTSKRRALFRILFYDAIIASLISAAFFAA